MHLIVQPREMIPHLRNVKMGPDKTSDVQQRGRGQSQTSGWWEEHGGGLGNTSNRDGFGGGSVQKRGNDRVWARIWPEVGKSRVN